MKYCEKLVEVCESATSRKSQRKFWHNRRKKLMVQARRQMRVRHQHSLFGATSEHSWNNSSIFSKLCGVKPCQQNEGWNSQLKGIEEEYIETIRDPYEVQKLTYELIKNSRTEIVIVCATSNAFMRQVRAGSFKSLEKVCN